MKIGQQDWLLFKERLPIWQNKHLEDTLKEYIVLLSDSSREPADKFWQLEKCVRRDKKHPGVIAEMSRDNVVSTIVTLLRDEIIAWDDLDGFSEELKELIVFFLKK